MPASKRWSLAMLIDACRKYGEITGKRIFFEWTLIAGKNDSPETARRLVELLRGIDAHINLIPLNPTGGFSGTESGTGHEFQEILIAGFGRFGHIVGRLLRANGVGTTVLDLDPDQKWLRLEILDTERGGLFDSDGVVEFRAHYTFGRERGMLHERSRFARTEGKWLYVDGDIG